MSYSFKLSRRITRLRFPVAAFLAVSLAACDNTESLNPESSSPEAVDVTPSADPIGSIEEDTPLEEDGPVQLAPVGEPQTASVSFAGGIPMGMFALPTSYFNSTYNGAFRNISPTQLRSELAAIRSRGGKVVLMFAGPYQYYQDAADHFSMTRWRERVNRYKGINFQEWVNDGTVIGHYLIDEPNDAANWGGRPVTPSEVEEMARYSKSLWPNMPTIVRVDATYLAYNHRYLDAAWAQYVTRKGTPSEYINRNVQAAKDRGLALVTGLNVIKGGPNASRMSPSQVRQFGLTLLQNSYPCAFISWQWRDVVNNSSYRDAMDALRNKAEARPSKSCRS
jgi:hypothetical protein